MINGQAIKLKDRGAEHETVINFCDEADYCIITTSSRTVYTDLLKRLGCNYLTREDEYSAVFVFPKAYLALPRIPFTS
jgi:hypothetical protein